MVRAAGLAGLILLQLTAGDAGAPAVRSWPAVPCVGGPCAAPNVCVNLDFTYVACVPCGGNDQVCCPHDGCDRGLLCGANPNFQTDPPKDLVQKVCQLAGSPPAADHGLNHQRRAIP